MSRGDRGAQWGRRYFSGMFLGASLLGPWIASLKPGLFFQVDCSANPGIPGYLFATQAFSLSELMGKNIPFYVKYGIRVTKSP